MFAKKRYGSSQAIRVCEVHTMVKTRWFWLGRFEQVSSSFARRKIMGSKFGFQGDKVLKRQVSDGLLGRNLKTKLCKNLGLGLRYHNVMRFYHNVCH
jgi:hypothetical protein